MARYSALRDDQWERIKMRLPGRKETVGVTARDHRLFVEAVLYRYRTGIPWRDLPERFGSWKAVHTRLSRWAEKGVWEKVFKPLAEDADHEYAMLDSPIVRAHPHSAGAKKTRPRRSDRPQQGRIEYPNPCDDRCAGEPNGLPSDSRASLRSGGC